MADEHFHHPPAAVNIPIRFSTAVAALASTVALPLFVATAASQEPRRLSEPDSIPLALASALVSAGGFTGEPQILVGSVPEWVTPKLFVPPRGRILGSAFLGTTLVAVVTLESASDSILADVRRGLMQRGWTVPPPTPVYTGGGFRPATTAINGNPYARDILCSDQQMLTATATRRRGVATDITMRIISTPGFSLCRPSQPYVPAVRSPMPTLYNPAGVNDARMVNECVSGNSVSTTGTSTLLRTPMTSEALLEHYGKQLLDSGWTSPAERGVVGRTWTRPDSAGTPIEVTLTVTPGRETGCRDVNMQVRTLRKP